MAYVGNPIDTQNTFQSLVGKRFNGDGSTTAITLDVAPSSTLDIEVFVGNVRQDPNSAYTLSGTTLTFTGAPPSGTNNIYVVHQAKSVGTIGIPDDTISARTLVTLDNSADHVLIEDATDGELKKALIPSASTVADTFTINGSTPTLTIGDAGAEDTKIVFDGNAQDFHIGLDDSSDDLVIGLGSALGTTTHMAFDEIGAVTKPLQPSYLAVKNGNTNNVTGDGTNVVVGDSTHAVNEIYDKNGDFDTSNGTFTCPVTGRYLMSFNLFLDNITDSVTDILLQLEASNRTVYWARDPHEGFRGSGGSYGLSANCILDGDANDTIKFKFTVSGTTKTVDLVDLTTIAVELLG